MPQHYKYLIIDDDEIDRLSVENEASKFPFLSKIQACVHPLEAIELIRRYQPDILFLDIEMPGMSGLELLEHLPSPKPLVVLITSHPEFALDGFEAEVLDYLLKPVRPDRFAMCVQRACNYFELKNKAFAFDKEQNANYIVIKQGYEKHKLNMQDMLYLEAVRDYTRIVTTTSHYLVLTTLAGMHSQLPPDTFRRIHRSYVVNVKKITALKDQKVLIASEELPVGKSFKNALNSIFP